MDDWAARAGDLGREELSGRRGPPRVDSNRPEFVLDGRRTATLDAFFAEFGRAVLGAEEWGAGLEALHEALRGGVGAAPADFRLVWRHVGVARAALGYPETVRQLTARLRDCSPNVLIKTAWALRAALRGEGATVYDWLVAAVREHENVVLVLEEGGMD